MPKSKIHPERVNFYMERYTRFKPAILCLGSRYLTVRPIPQNFESHCRLMCLFYHAYIDPVQLFYRIAIIIFFGNISHFSFEMDAMEILIPCFIGTKNIPSSINSAHISSDLSVCTDAKKPLSKGSIGRPISSAAPSNALVI